MVCRLNCVRGNSAHLDLDGVKKDQSPCMEMSSFLNTDGSSIIRDTDSSYIMQIGPEGFSSSELCGSVKIISGAFRQNELFHCSQP